MRYNRPHSIESQSGFRLELSTYNSHYAHLGLVLRYEGVLS
nr:MAG TPA: hypothetical protein [Bacteriophage sp.]